MEQLVALAGDWHADSRWAGKALRALADRGVTEVFHLGDFGVWPGPSGRAYRYEVQAALDALGMVLFVTPGNHEDYEQIERLPLADLGHDMGEISWLTERIGLLPRGHRFQRGEWSFVSLGGATSVDREMRVEGESWWPGEQITESDVARVVAGGPADVMLTHDSPGLPYAAAAVAEILQAPPIWPQRVLERDAEGRERLTRAFAAVQPRVLAHGHFHVADIHVLRAFGHETLLISLGANGPIVGNLGLLTLPDKSAGLAPTVEWIAVPPRSIEAWTLDLVDGQAPPTWGIDQMLIMIDRGRSAHWNTLIVAAQRGASPEWLAELNSALALTTNDAARRYLLERLPQKDLE